MTPDPDDDPLRIAREVDALCDQYEAALREEDPPALSPYLERIEASGRKSLLEELTALAVERLRKQGAADPAAWLLEANQDLASELQPLLSESAETAPHTPSGGGSSGRGLHIRCPHCHNPIELVPDAELESIRCPSCGSDFSLVGDGVTTREAEKVTNVGHFQLVERVGMGAFGSVWKAHDTKLDRTVAVKIPRKGQFDAEQEKKFFREAQNAAQLNHPSIVPVHEVGRDGDTLYIVSDFVRGLTLADWLTGQRPTVREAVELCEKIAEALHHAHERGVVHRDLKPGNIMLDAEDRPYLMDFGLAKREAVEVTMSLDGQVLGTPAYMSPEQAQGEAHDADRRSDVYSLGVILFQLLTGELPFRGNARMLIHQVIHDEPPSPRKLNAEVPRDLETITLKCLEKDPPKRYATAEEVGDELRCYLDREPIHARPIGPMRRGWRWCRRNRSSVAAILLVLLGLYVIFVSFAFLGLRLRLASQRASAAAALAHAEARIIVAESKTAEARAQVAVAEQKTAVAEQNAAEAQEQVAEAEIQRSLARKETARAEREQARAESARADAAAARQKADAALAELERAKRDLDGKWARPESGQPLGDIVTEFAPVDADHTLLGVWRHRHPRGDLVLRVRRNGGGQLVADYLVQRFSYYPVAVTSSATEDRVIVLFKMVLYETGEPRVSRHTIRYDLRLVDGKWRGEMNESWQEPLDVRLEALAEDADIAP